MVPDVASLLSVTITVFVVLPFMRYGTLFSIKFIAVLLEIMPQY